MVRAATRARWAWKIPAALLLATLMAFLVTAAGSRPAYPAVTAEIWSDPATWGGAVPGEGDTVTIPSGKTVVLDTSPPRLAGLQVDGTLRFKDKNLTLSSDWIVVHGRLEVGTETTPFRSKARIILTGDNRTQNVMNMGAKVLGVMGGTLDIHGPRAAS